MFPLNCGSFRDIPELIKVNEGRQHRRTCLFRYGPEADIFMSADVKLTPVPSSGKQKVGKLGFRV